MRLTRYLLVLMLTTFFISCEKDLDTAEWKEISVVYGVINIKDTAQYVRINRAYSSPHSDPLLYTQVNDSVNYSQELFEVFLEEYRDGEIVGEPLEYYAVDRQKEPGLFSNESNCVFKTTKEIKEGCEYKIRVINKETGHETWGRAPTFGGVSIKESFSWERAFYRVNYPAERLPDYEGSLDPNEVRQYIVRFLYWEFQGGETYYKYVDWVPHLLALKDSDTSLQMFDGYWEYLAEQIPVDPNVKRQARGIDYMLALPGNEIQQYITVYEQPSNPHFYPEYSNMSEGQGVFGCKYYYTYFGMQLKIRTIDTISWGRHLINHRFADSHGEWH